MNKFQTMDNYSVRKLAKLAGVSVRTLHLYDQIGLLKPSVRTEARYRLYGEKELLRLQQILFYRELDFPLKAIGEILDDPDFDLIQALESHKTALQTRGQRIHTLIGTIDKTLTHLKNKTMLKLEELYEGLPPQQMEEYRELAMQRWGKEKILQGEEALRKLSKAEILSMRGELDALMKQLHAMMDLDPASEAVQSLIARHHTMILQFGGGWEELKKASYYKGLGELYVSDGRYTTVNGTPDSAFAAFMRSAMRHFASRELS